MIRRASVVVAFAFASAFACEARADDAADLKQRADQEMRALHYREALDLYDRAYAATHDPAILYNRARAEQALGDYPAALDAIEAFARTAPEELKSKVPRLDRLVEEIRARVALVSVRCPISGASVMVDGRLVGTTPLPAPLRVAAGNVRIAVEAPGYKAFHADVKTTGNGVETVDVALTAEEPTHVRVGVRHETYTPSGYRAAAFTFGALGLAGIALGATFGGLVAWKASDASSSCPNKVCTPAGWNDVRDATTFATISDVGFIAGGALLATSIVLFIVAPKRHREIAITPIVGPAFIGIGGAL